MTDHKPDSKEKPLEHFADEIMVKDVLTIESGTSVKKAVELMTRKGHGCLVVQEKESIVGIVTERDILNKITAEGVNPARVLIQDIMTAPIITVNMKSTIAEIAEKMNTFHVRRTVVVDRKGDMAGLVMAEDLAGWLAKRSKYSDPSIDSNAEIRSKGSGAPYG